MYVFVCSHLVVNTVRLYRSVVSTRVFFTLTFIICSWIFNCQSNRWQTNPRFVIPSIFYVEKLCFFFQMYMHSCCLCPIDETYTENQCMLETFELVNSLIFFLFFQLSYRRLLNIEKKNVEIYTENWYTWQLIITKSHLNTTCF